MVAELEGVTATTGAAPVKAMPLLVDEVGVSNDDNVDEERVVLVLVEEALI